MDCLIASAATLTPIFAAMSKARCPADFRDSTTSDEPFASAAFSAHLPSGWRLIYLFPWRTRGTPQPPAPIPEGRPGSSCETCSTRSNCESDRYRMFLAWRKMGPDFRFVISWPPLLSWDAPRKAWFGVTICCHSRLCHWNHIHLCQELRLGLHPAAASETFRRMTRRSPTHSGSRPYKY